MHVHACPERKPVGPNARMASNKLWVYRELSADRPHGSKIQKKRTPIREYAQVRELFRETICNNVAGRRVDILLNDPYLRLSSLLRSSLLILPVVYACMIMHTTCMHTTLCHYHLDTRRLAPRLRCHLGRSSAPALLLHDACVSTVSPYMPPLEIGSVWSRSSDWYAYIGQ